MSGRWWVLDNGCGTLKSSSCSSSCHSRGRTSDATDTKALASSPLITLENAVLAGSGGRRQGFSDELKDFSSLYWSRPCEQEFVTDFMQQAVIWQHLQRKMEVQGENDLRLLCSSPLTSFDAVDDGLAEIAFEELGCSHFGLIEAPAMASYGLSGDFQLVVDTGFASTRVCAVYRHDVVPSSVVRMPIGGRVLTNFLKDTVSYRHINVSDQQQLVEELKLQTTVVVEDYALALKQAKRKRPADNPHMVDYLLPDFAQRLHGSILPRAEMGPKVPRPTVGRQVIRLTNETFSPGELFFHPNDIGIDSIGLPECIALSLRRCPDWMQASLVRNIVVIGGNANIPGLLRRIQLELPCLLPQELGPPTILSPTRPELAAWKGGCRLVQDEDSAFAYILSKEAFAEQGTLRLRG